MAERIGLWWARRQFSRGVAVPYPVGAYRDDWSAYPALIRQYHPDLNEGITLTQIPPAADVLLCWQCDSGHLFAATPEEQRNRPGRTRRRSAWCPECAMLAAPPPMRVAGAPRPPARARRLCPKTPDLRTGEPFASACAPKPASAVEGRLRAELFGALSLEPHFTAVRLARPFFDHLEAWPDLVLSELRIAVEYDSIGRHGLEHVGEREKADRRKDRLLREAGWEVVRIRTGKLAPLGPHDLVLATWGRGSTDLLLDAFRRIRGDLLVDAYVR